MNGSLKSIIQLGMALLLALSAGILVYQWMQAKATAGRGQAVRTVPLVVATRELPAGAKLSADMLRLQNYPETMTPAQHYTTVKEVEGRILASGMSANEPLTPSRLSGESASGGISAVITHGKRAMAVKGNKVMGLAGLIRPGNMVDVLVTLPKDEKGQSSMTKVVLENVPVLAAGAQMTSEKDEAAQHADIYTLELTPQESEKVALASTQGTLHFALRNASDTEVVLTEGADVKTALASYRTARVARGPRGSGNTVEIITGSKRSQVTF
ncbi:MAG: Flp pilus assembly protein CpaB [Humidesulfovibrio sp.]|uniref:Flp pilus assembly protein CpaB n=1 Tax=Humidesulfovibrio sp. TaxID=2910988 RepID=UPI0027F5B3DD|nr:Flp pilus assembly protein CpaB [Humidesulfovibrio sp.]MDQ7836646.1 Flp pilus assembly protein CpaB [Humidesulfovibrio sp.]